MTQQDDDDVSGGRAAPGENYTVTVRSVTKADKPHRAIVTIELKRGSETKTESLETSANPTMADRERIGRKVKALLK